MDFLHNESKDLGLVIFLSLSLKQASLEKAMEEIVADSS
jgi:hypothetical protein